MSEKQKALLGFNPNDESSYFYRYSKFKINDRFIREGGEYEMVIVSAYYHTTRKGRKSIVIIFKDLKTEKIAKVFMVVASKTGRTDNPLRRYENYLFDSLLIVTDSSKDTELKEVMDWDYKAGCLVPATKIAFYDLIGKKCKVVLGYRIKVEGYYAYISYAIGGLFDYETNQSADEILDNEIATLYFLPRETMESENGSFGEKTQICRIRY